MTDREATQEVITLCGEDGMAVRPPGNCLRANLMPFAVGKRNPGKRIVVIVPDFAERYLSTTLFEGLD